MWSDPAKERAAKAGSDRKSTRLNSSHSQISYAVFCLKQKRDMSSDSQHVPDFHAHACRSWSGPGLRSLCRSRPLARSYFFLNDTATTEIYTLSLHDALPILPPELAEELLTRRRAFEQLFAGEQLLERDRKSTRLNSSHSQISYAVFCLKKKINSITCEFLASVTILLRS